MVGWHHQLHEHEIEQTLINGGGQAACCAIVQGVQRVERDLATEHKKKKKTNQIVVTELKEYNS